MNKFFKKNLPAAIIAAVLLAVVILSGASLKENFNKDGYQAPTDQTKNGSDVQVDNEKNNGLNNEENESNNEENPELETYESELFIEAKWGTGKGEVGLFNPSEQGIEDAGPNYGPQSFDINESNGHLFLLDSINKRVIEYGESGKYLRDFSIGIGATTDIKIKDEHIYILSFGSDAVYKLDMSGKILETYLITPGKNPGIGNGGIEFDEDENIMVETSIDGYNDDNYRFYQIGPNGDEWKTNSYVGNITRDKKGFYFIKGIDWLTRKVQILDRSESVQKEFTVKLPQKAYVYYYGSDENNIYLNIGYKDFIETKEGISDEFVFKYDKKGTLLAKFDLFVPLRKFFSDDEILAIPKLYLYANDFINVRISKNGEMHRMFSFKDKGIMIFKYSKTE